MAQGTGNALEMYGAALLDPDVKFIPRGDFGPRELVSLTKAASPQTRYASAMGAGDLTAELGRSGLRHWGGFVFEEWLRELQQGQRAAQVYREMLDQWDIIGACSYAITQLIRRVSWRAKPADSSREAQQGADFLWQSLNDMRFSWADTIGEIFMFLFYGWGWHEQVFKIRNGESRDKTASSKYDDGLISWSKIPVRSQDSLWKWVFDDVGETVGMIQNPPPDYLLRFIPSEKSLHFRTTIYKDNPEGRSIIRSSYKAYYMVRNFQAIEGIGIERDLAGIPMLEAPEGTDIWNALDAATAPMLQYAKNLVSSLRRDEQEGIVLPSGWKLSLLTTGGRRQLDIASVIQRYELRALMATLTDVIALGTGNVGSYALAVTKKDLLSVSLGAFLDIVSSQFNTDGVDTLWRINNLKWPKPTLEHGAVETVDIDTLGNLILRLGQSGAPMDWETALPWVMKQAGMPEPQEGHDFTPRDVPRSASDAPTADPPERPVAKAHVSLADLNPADLAEMKERLGSMASMVQIVLDR